MGLAVSAFGVLERRVALGTLGLILLVTFGFPLAWSWLAAVAPGSALDLLPYLSPIHAFKHIGSTFRAAEFWGSMGMMCALSHIFVLVASLAIKRGIGDVAMVVGEEPVAVAKPKSSPVGLFDLARVARKRRLEANPFSWVLSRDERIKILLFFFSVIAIGVLSWVLEQARKRGGNLPGKVFLVAIALHWGVKMLAASEAARRFHEDRWGGSLELLLCTPLRVGSILRAQETRLIALFLAPCLLLLLINVVIARPGIPTLVAGMTLIPDMIAISYAGMYYGLQMASFTRAVFSAFWRVLVPSAALLAIIVVCGTAWRMHPQWIYRCFLGWVAIVCAYDLALALFLRSRLQKRFRRMAAA